MKEEMEQFPEINWSQVACSAFEQEIAELKVLTEFTRNSEITPEMAEEMGKEVNRLLSKQYGIKEE